MTDTYAPSEAEAEEMEELLDELLSGDLDDADLDDALDDGKDLGEDDSPAFRTVASFDTREDAQHWIAEQAKTGTDTSRYVIVDAGLCFNVEVH